jgi:restriction system protein
MGRRRKKEDTPIEVILSLFVGIVVFSKTNNLNKSITVVIISLITILSISFTIRYIIKQKYRTKLLSSGIDIVDKMNGVEFEKFLLVHFQKLGYKGQLTPATNDYGADLILSKDGEKIVVQAKRWTSKVGIEAIQQIIGAKQYYKASKCIVATNNYFTPNAENLASNSGVELWNRTKLLDIMSDSNGREVAKEVTNEFNINHRNMCPKCGSEMILKKGKRGSFYGCSLFPKCKYTKDI